MSLDAYPTCQARRYPNSQRLRADWVPEWEVEPKFEVPSDMVMLPETPGWHLPADFADVVANTPLR